MALGANEITIGTPLLIAENCIFCRGCSSGNCPVGITTLDKEKEDERFMQLRLESRGSNHGNSNERYIAARDGIIRYLDSLASEFKTILATLRLSDPKMLVGRVDLLEQKETGNERWDRLDLSDMLIDLNSEEDENQEMPTGGLFDRNSEILSAASEILSGESGKARIDLSLTNRDHSIGASLAGEISKRELQGSNIKFDIDATGYAGQGFGFGATSGMNLRLKGYANDGAGTAMSGSANITIIPSSNYKNINTPHLVGNAAAYGATGGKLFVAGKAGQRFGVRNSGATLVSEGVGKYAFEYMTGGIGVVLGRCGPVVGSGMTGGILFIYDPDKKIKEVLHRDITTHYLDDESQDVLKRILVDYKNKTESEIAGGILRDWSNQLQAFAFVKSEF
jgi:glutamate synthase (NADPH/NADH) large chain